MAACLAQELVTFTDSSVENISLAKEFWRAIDGNFDKKSHLFVTGVNHRLRTASGNKRSKSKEDVLRFSMCAVLRWYY